ncbi:MAG TPA: hypothetical protein PLK34_02090 [Candidatus Pacearchaeota archaeon]|nr:hypothetical protein [Candidatus Pacearchaeota archaeon]
MKIDNLVLFIASFAVFLSALGAGLTYYNVNQYRENWFTGFALQSGDINLTVETAAAINFTVDSINWGSGMVDSGQSSATLNTCCGGSVVNGNWTAVSQGFEVVNLGNVNLTLLLKTGKTAATFLGGTAVTPDYEFNVTNKEADACNGTDVFNLNTFYDVNTTGDGTKVCDLFTSAEGRDEIRIDIKLVIPSDSLTGARSDTMTATIAPAS